MVLTKLQERGRTGGRKRGHPGELGWVPLRPVPSLLRWRQRIPLGRDYYVRRDRSDYPIDRDRGGRSSGGCSRRPPTSTASRAVLEASGRRSCWGLGPRRPVTDGSCTDRSAAARSGAPASFSGVFEDWFDLVSQGRKALLPAPRKYPDELRERAVQLYRSLSRGPRSACSVSS